MKPGGAPGILAAVLLVAACSKQPMVMNYFPERPEAASVEDAAPEAIQEIVWPAAPEIPRYRYAGQLVGEQNFGYDQRMEMGRGEKVLRWIVGLARGGGNDPMELARPQDGVVGPDGRIYVTDSGRQAVLVFDLAQARLEVWLGADRNNDFISPVGITEGPRGEILVADSKLGRVVRLDLEGNALGSFGSGILQRPTGLAFDPATGYVYVADTAAHDIKIFGDDGSLLDAVGERGSALGEFNGPTHLDFSHGKLYVTDTLNARVQVLNAAGEGLTSVGQRGLFVGNLTRPKGVTVDTDGNIYVIESYYDHMLVFRETGELLLPIGGTGSAIGQFFLPAGIWSDTQDRIFIADMFNSRVVIMQYLGD